MIAEIQLYLILTQLLQKNYSGLEDKLIKIKTVYMEKRPTDSHIPETYLGILYLETDRLVEAETLLVKAYEKKLQFYGETIDIAMILRQLGRLYHKNSNHMIADQHFVRALALENKFYIEEQKINCPELAKTYLAYGVFLCDTTRDITKATEYAEKAAHIFSMAYPHFNVLHKEAKSLCERCRKVVANSVVSSSMSESELMTHSVFARVNLQTELAVTARNHRHVGPQSEHKTGSN